MTAGQFHLEAELDDRVSTRFTDKIRTDQATDAGIVSLLIGIVARGWLTDSEKEFLDSLVPSRSICFLIYNGNYLHPEALPLLQPDQLEASYLHENAVFSHRQRLVSNGSTSSRIQSARLGELNGKQLTFGMIGQDHWMANGGSDDRFLALIDRFRTALPKVRLSIDRIVNGLCAEAPMVVVNRCSGRIVAANNQILSMCESHLHQLVGSEFTVIRDELSDHLSTHLLHAENVRVGEIDLSLVSLRPRQTKAFELADQMYPRFVASLRRATQALHMTAHHLEGIISWQAGHPETELLRLIQEETNELEQIVHRYHLLTMFGQLKQSRLNPAESLRSTVTRAAINHPHRQLTMTEQWTGQVEMSLPAEALAVLYETVLETHLLSCGCQTTTTVMLEVDGEQRLTIRVQTSAKQTDTHMHFSTDWTDYIASLGRLLGFHAQHQHHDGTMLETILMHHKDLAFHEQSAQ